MTPMLLSVTDWGELFETSRTRELKTVRSVCFPNEFTNRKIRRLAMGAGGAERLGTYLAVCAVASRCPYRGVLMLDTVDGPLDAESLSALTGLSIKAFDRCLPVLIEVGLVRESVITGVPGRWELPPEIAQRFQPFTRHRKKEAVPASPAASAPVIPFERGGYLDGATNPTGP